MRVLSRPVMLGLLLLLTSCLTQPPPPTGAVEGTVTIAGAEPVPGAEVTLVPVGGVGSGIDKRATTDAAGGFRIAGVAVGSYGLTAVAPGGLGGFAPSVAVMEDAATSVGLELAPLGSLTGSADFADRLDRPDDGATIDVFLLGTPFHAVADPAGGFRFDGVPAGTYELSVRSPGYEQRNEMVTVEQGAESTLPERYVLERRAPYALFTVDVVGNSVMVDASASYDVDGGVAGYGWEFGDGRRATGVTATHTYTGGGTMTIRLTVVDDDGNTTTASRSVTIVVERVRAGTSPGAVAARPTIGAGRSAQYEVVVPAAAGKGLLYLETTSGLVLQAAQGDDVYYSATPDRFTRGSPGADAALRPQAIVSNVLCQGPCILLPATGGSVMVSIANPTSATVRANLVAYVDRFSDANEPNDGAGTATPLLAHDSGAIELIGDRDYYRVSRAGRLLFENPPTTIALRATVYDAAGSQVATLRDGGTVQVSDGFHVVVEAEGENAAPSGRSFYFLTLD